ncbi:MAG: hypothetical protein ACREYF_07195 [Gammaproteobacteria bacterium]
MKCVNYVTIAGRWAGVGLFPVSVAIAELKEYTKPGDWVFDPFDELWKAEDRGERSPAIGARRRAKQETHRAVESLWEPCRTASWCDAADAERSRHNHLSRDAVHFGDRMAEMHHEHSDTLARLCSKAKWLHGVSNDKAQSVC